MIIAIYVNNRLSQRHRNKEAHWHPIAAARTLYIGSYTMSSVDSSLQQLSEMT